jgi:flagellar motor switch protein FliG
MKNSSLFYNIKSLKNKQIFFIIKNMNLQYVAVLLYFMPSKRASTILEFFDIESQTDIIKRMASLKKIKEQNLKLLEALFDSKIKHYKDLDGKNNTINILRNLKDKHIILEKLDKDLVKELECCMDPIIDNIEKGYELD